MLVCPAGAPPFPQGPVTVINCVYFDPITEISAYVVLHGDGRCEPVDGVEMVSYTSWAEWMKQNAN